MRLVRKDRDFSHFNLVVIEFILIIATWGDLVELMLAGNIDFLDRFHVPILLLILD